MYDQITDSIIAKLEEGTAPWVKPWSAGASGADRNVTTDRAYNGINRLVLGMQGRSSSLWATYNQWQSMGVQVQKGEKSTAIVFFKPVSSTKTNAQGETETSGYAIMKGFNVFNAEQTDYEIPLIDSMPSFEPSALCETRMAMTGAIIRHGGDSAHFTPSTDSITLPHRDTFNTADAYYATAFHELTHWTGVKARLDRDMNGRFGNEAYAFEELVAELGSAFLCADHHISGQLQHANYIASWLRVLKSDNKAVFKASALAQKASDYINSLDATLQQVA